MTYGDIGPVIVELRKRLEHLEREPGTWRHACGRFLKYSRDVAPNAGACPRCGTRFSPNGLSFLSAIEEIETEQDELAEVIVEPAPEEGSSN